MYVFAGLGNPDSMYAETRHNAGFKAVDALHDKIGALPWKSFKSALVSTGSLGGEKVLLVKPQKYMNNSGEVIAPILAYYKVPTDKLVVIYDDIDLELGRLRIRKSGGPGTHNGMRSITPYLGEGFARIRIGVSQPQFGDLADYVLGKPKGEERVQFDLSADRAAQAAQSIVTDGIDKAMQVFNI